MSLALPALVRAHNGEDHGPPTPMASMSGSDAMSGSDSMSDMPGMTSGTPMPGMSGDSMSGMSSGDSMTGDSMSGMNMSDYIDILPLWVSVIWIVALAAVLVFHCGHLIHMGGQHRWFHATHIVMLIGMLYMYAGMAFNWNFIPGPVCVWLYALTSAAMVIWMVMRVVQKKPFSYLWILAFISQAAMIYMWMPMSSWVAWLSWGLVVYFTLETIAWLAGLCDDGKEGRGNAVGPGDRSLVMPLGNSTVWGKVSMAIMAASMAYMFAGMQLMV